MQSSLVLQARYMIVLDEGIHGHFIIKPIASWYSGRVISVTALRPKTVIKDDAIPVSTSLCPSSHIHHHQHNRLLANRLCRFALLYSLLRSRCKANQNASRLTAPSSSALTEFKTRESRLGKVARVRSNRIDYYELDKRVHTLTRSD